MYEKKNNDDGLEKQIEYHRTFEKRVTRKYMYFKVTWRKLESSKR